MKTLLVFFGALIGFSAVGQDVIQFGRRIEAPSGSGYSVASASFDGVNDQISFSGSAVTMSGSGTAFTIAGMIDLDTDGSAMFIVQGRSGGSGPAWNLRRTSGNVLELVVQNSSSVTVLDVFTTTAVAEAADGKIHFYITADLTSTSTRAFYINGSAAAVDWYTYNTSGVMALDRTDLYIGADDGLGNDFGGDVAQLWFDDAYWAGATYISAFYNSGPVDLGATGSIPTGASPDGFFRFVGGSLGVNSGADGGTGTLTGDVTSGATFP